MDVRDLDLKTAKSFLNVLEHICFHAEKQMSSYVGYSDPDLEVDGIDYEFTKRERAEYELFSPAYRPISDLWGELTAHVKRLELGLKR